MIEVCYSIETLRWFMYNKHIIWFKNTDIFLERGTTCHSIRNTQSTRKCQRNVRWPDKKSAVQAIPGASVVYRKLPKCCK